MKRFLAITGSLLAIFTPAVVLAYGAGFGSGGTSAGSAASTGGVIFNSNTAPAGTNAYWNYDGTNLVGNVPTGKGFAFAVNGSNQVTVSNAGVVAAPQVNITGANSVAISNQSSGGLQILGNAADGATKIALLVNNAQTLSTAGAKLVDVQNNTVDKGYVSYAGGMTLSSSLTIVSSGGIAGGAANAVITQAGNATFNQMLLPLNGGGTSTANNVYSNGSGIVVNAPTNAAVQLDINAVAQATFAAVSANSTNINGQANISHLAGGSGAPTSPTAGTGCGTSSVPAVGGSDLAGHLDVKCGSAGTAGNHIITATFAHAYNTAPVCVISPANAATEGGLITGDEIPVTTTTTISIDCGTGGTCPNGGASLLSWNYFCGQ